MQKRSSKIAAIAIRAWSIPRLHKLIITGVIALVAVTGLEIEPGTVEAIGAVLMIAHEVMGQ